MSDVLAISAACLFGRLKLNAVPTGDSGSAVRPALHTNTML